MACAFLLVLALDLTNATVISREAMPARVLIEEVEKRTRIRWKTSESGAPAILIRNANAGVREGFSIATSGSTVTVTGNDARGTLFGVGYLLRQLRWSRDAASVPDNLNFTTAPKIALRGHQLGYRPKPNSYDGWTAAMWDQYIRELALFGTNAIELIPPRSDDDPDSPHFPVKQMPMMIEMSRIIDSYGLDCWIWYPALDEDYSKPEQVEFALNEWAEVIRQLPRVDAVFVPGGDPGHTPPKVLMPFLEKQAASIRRYHPKAQMWVAPQGFTKAWMDDFFELLRAEPKWLTGVVYGPQSRMTIHELRAATPKAYPLRHYPDITHTLNSQFPVPDWDFPLARTHNREPINPRPVDQAIIFRHTNPVTAGFLTYSEGCNDDVNKFVWSALGWNPDGDLTEALRDYSRLFFGPGVADAMAQLIFALERNWRGPLYTNGGVAVTLAQAQAIEREASPQLRLNWRFQQLLYRAYFDAYVRARWFHESSAEDWSYDKLRRSPETGTLAAMAAAESILDNAANEPVAIDLRQRVYALAEALYQSIRMQLSVANYQGEPGRGNTLDSVEAQPLNNRTWLKAQFARIRKMEKESDRLVELRKVVEWENPGPGGFYDDLGNPSRQPHLVRAIAYADDPSGLKGPLVAFGMNTASAPWRTSWLTDAQAYYDATLTMRYTGLDPSARYRVEVLDGSIASDTFEMRLVANDSVEVHGWRKKQPGQRLSFVVPQSATASGELKLTWHPTLGRGGAGRGLQLAEVWLVREPSK